MITMSPGRSVGDEDLLDIDPEALNPAALRLCNATLPTASRANWSIGMARWCVSAAKRKSSRQLTHIYDCLLPQELHALGKIA